MMWMLCEWLGVSGLRCDLLMHHHTTLQTAILTGCVSECVWTSPPGKGWQSCPEGGWRLFAPHLFIYGNALNIIKVGAIWTKSETSKIWKKLGWFWLINIWIYNRNRPTTGSHPECKHMGSVGCWLHNLAHSSKQSPSWDAGTSLCIPECTRRQGHWCHQNGPTTAHNRCQCLQTLTIHKHSRRL